jgi:hypothetical protein
MPRFVILEHDHPELHWGFMLEAGDVLRTWRLAGPPRADGPVPATAAPDHRRAYLDYEGPVSGNRGRVRRWDAGVFAWEVEEDGRVAVRVEGARLRGTVRLEHTGGAWACAFVPDESGLNPCTCRG